MNLLGAVYYDPAGAVSKATSSLLAMTAFDTTNLRVTVTVPAHGYLRFRISGPCILGATTFPQVFLGVMTGATVVCRSTPLGAILGTALATTHVPITMDMVVSGLSAGSTAFDAAYAVQVVLASTNIKYGGPNDATGADAFGGFSFEIWDPRPIPTAAPGAANGLQICGSCADTTYATLTSTGAFTVNGVSAVSQTGDSYAICKSGGTGDNAAIKAKTDNLPAAPASTTNITAASGVSLAASQHVIVDSGTVTTLTNLPAITSNWLTAAGINAGALNGKGDWLLSSSYTAQTGDAYARLGAPAGASVSADIAAAKVDTAAIKAKTDSLTFSVAGKVDGNIKAVNSVTVNGNGAGTPWGP